MESDSNVLLGKKTEEERKAKAIDFLKECGFTSTKCCLCGKQVDTQFERLMQCARCQIAHYCSMKCVQRDFEQHRETCLLALEFGKFLPPEDPPKEELPQTPAGSNEKRRKPKSTLSSKSLEAPVTKKASVPRKAQSLYAKVPTTATGANEPALIKPPRVKKSKSASSEQDFSPSDDRNRLVEETKASNPTKKKKKAKSDIPSEASVPVKGSNINDKEGNDVKDDNVAIQATVHQGSKTPDSEESVSDENKVTPSEAVKPTPPSSTNEAKPKKLRKPLQRHKSTDEVLATDDKPQRAKLRRVKSVDESGVRKKLEKGKIPEPDTDKNRNRINLGVSGLPKRVEDEADSKNKKDRNCLSGGRFTITQDGDVKMGVRKLLANDGQCCYCGKTVPKHLMLQCARCKLAYYCKMNCLQEDFDLHRAICNFVVEYSDYATLVEIDTRAGIHE